MADHHSVQYQELSEATQGFIRPDSPPGARMAAARGLLPLVTDDLAVLLCYLLEDEDTRIAKQARRSLRDLPQSLLENLLGSRINWKVLDYFAKQKLPEERLYERILFNRTTSDETFVWLAKHSELSGILDLIASNQERMLRTKEIVSSLAQNAHTPASTVARIRQFFTLQTGSDEIFQAEPEVEAVEEPPTAAVEEIDEDLPEATELDLDSESMEAFEALPEEEEEIPDISIDDLKNEVFEEDAIFASEFLLDPEQELSSEEQKSLTFRILKMNVMDQMRLALKGNGEARSVLIKSSNKMIQECVLQNPRITIEEVLKVARNKSMREEIVRLVTQNKDWTKNYQVKLNLTFNPKTPLTIALKYLPLLNERDLASIAKSKQVPGMLSVAARKMIQQKQRFK